MGSPGRVSAGHVSSPRLAGRRPEVEQLEAALERAAEGGPALILLTGDAGMGKTRLVRELESRAASQDALALRGQCLELSVGELPYAPIAAALRSADDAVLAAGLAELPHDARRELARVFPDSIADVPGEGARDDRFGQSRLFGWILALLQNLATTSTVVLVVEDVHLADTSSRDFLRFLAQSLRDERLLTVVTARSDELHRDHPARALLTELLRHDRVMRIELTPLSEADIRHQVEGIIGEPPPAGLVARLFRRAQGNPFYTEELLAAGVGDGELLPDTLQDALLARADRLDAPARELLRLTAAGGRPIDERLIERAADLPRREVEAGLRQCVDQNILVCDRRTGRYSVRHALVGEAVYADLLPVERASLHRRIAVALGESATAENAGERAHHWQQAGETSQALLASIEAGEAAERVFGYGEALAHFSRAVELWGERPEGPDGAPANGAPSDGAPADGAAGASLDRVALLAHAAQAARWMGESDTARELCRRALAGFDHADDPLRAARLYERLGRYQPWDVEAALEAFRRGLELLPPECTAERMRLFVDEALEFSFQGRWEDTRDRAAEAIDLALGEKTLAPESAARALLGTAIAFLGDPVAGSRALREALALAQRANSTEDLVQIYLDLGEVLRLEGRIDQALETMIEGELAAHGLGALPFANFMAANAADDLLRLGRWAELELRLAELERRELDRPAELLMLSVAGRLHTARGDFDRADACLGDAAELCRELDLLEYVPAVYGGLAELELWRGRPDAARERVTDGFGILGSGENLLHMPTLHAAGARVEADRAELARARRDPDGAVQAADAAAAHRAALDGLLRAHDTGVTVPEATAQLASAVAEVTRARRDPNPACWQDAVARWQAHDNGYQVAYASYRCAEALVLTRRSRSEAQAALARAASLAGELGAEPLSAAVHALARRARISLVPAPGTAAAPAPAAGEPENPYGLTGRELEVLALLGAGLTNREISQTLFISQHTAGVHVSHILAKLGVANRVMAAGVAERLGLTPRPASER